MREEETDLSFADFGSSKRLYPAPSEIGDDQESTNPLIQMARREGVTSQQSWRCLVGPWPTETPDPQVLSTRQRAGGDFSEFLGIGSAAAGPVARLRSHLIGGVKRLPIRYKLKPRLRAPIRPNLSST